ncbi:MAG: hypothetical protein IPL31_17085 [Saprospiraceae bacterium]|nr:hypothetical protein [Saprospiraceae bacterium]
MSRKTFFLTVSFIIISKLCFACDICGCNIANHGIGILNSIDNSLISLRWGQSQFKGNSNAKPMDYFNVAELAATYKVSSSLKLSAYIPYHYNLRKTQSTNQSIQGIADSKVSATWIIVNPPETEKSTQIYFETSMGIKLPTGKYRPSIHNLELPENFNIGNGSWGFALNPALIVKHKTMGVLLSGDYLYQTASRSAYKFGNQFQTQCLVYWEKNLLNEFKCIPYLGFYGEWAGTDQYANDQKVEGTGGNGKFFVGGLNVKFQEWMLGLSFAKPFSQNYSNGETRIINKFSTQISYFF